MALSLLIILLAAVFVVISPERLRNYRGWILSVLPAVLFVYFLGSSGDIAKGTTLKEFIPWMPALGIDLYFYLDSLSLLFTLLITGIGVFIFIYAGEYMKNYAHNRRFFFYILLFFFSMMGLVTSGNLIVLFVFWELTSISSFFLIGFFSDKKEARAAAIQALLVTGLGGLALLSGILLVGKAVGSYNIDEIIAGKHLILNSRYYLPALMLMLAGAFTKSAQFPFHFWLPGAMQAPSPVSAFLHSATMVKAGIYLMLRISPFMANTPQWEYIVSSFGAATMFVGAYMAISKKDLKGILANTTVSALGMLTLLIGIDTRLSVKAALLFLIIHSLYKANLFMIAGAIDKKTGTRDISRLGGLLRRMPVASVAAIIALFSMSGLPPMLGFIGKEIIYEAKLQTPGIFNPVLIFGVASNVFMVWISALFIYRVFLGQPAKGVLKEGRPGFGLVAGPVVFAILTLAFGLFPGILGERILEPALIASRVEILDIKLKLWHGFNQVFMLSALTVLSGLVLFFFSKPLIPLITRINTRLFYQDFSGGFTRMIDSVLSFSKKKTEIIQHGYHRIYLSIIFVFAASLILYQLLTTRGWVFSADFRDLPFYVLAVPGLILAAIILTVTTGSRLVAIISMGVVGYGIASLYLIYGGIDLAITQILIETLTVILFVLVIKRLPRFRKLSSRGTRIRDALIALFVGGVMTGLTIKAGSLNLNPSVSSYFIEKSLPEGFGRNIVNVILVDFRALDTLGEITVLMIAAVGVVSLIKYKTGK